MLDFPNEIKQEGEKVSEVYKQTSWIQYRRNQFHFV
jgi:hypothetical protein